MNHETVKKIFKVVTKEQWIAAETEKVFKGAPIDLKDGFIHFSTELQLDETIKKHFSGQKGLLIVEVAVEKLDDLRWEISRGGDFFPHLYGFLSLDSVTQVNEFAPE